MSGPSFRCELEMGVILRRRCRDTAQTQCEGCGKRVCLAHHRPHTRPGQQPIPWCIDCIRRAGTPTRQPELAQDEPRVLDTVGFDNGGFETAVALTDAVAWQGGGGDFGGGGASGGWDDKSQFSADDYAAFDRTVEADRNGGQGSYDS